MPRSIPRQLSRLRRRERLLRLSWGVARWFAVAVAVLAVACLIDWLFDRRIDTPVRIRIGLLLGQVVLWLWTAERFLLKPLFHRLRDDDLALWVEGKAPAFEHRLISAVQLTRPEASTRGMSRELIVAIDRQAEEQASQLDFRQLLDRRRLRRGLGLAAGVAVPCLLFFIMQPDLATALVARQFLADREIPRSLSIVAVGPEVWPAGEGVDLRFRVTGEGFSEDSTGEVRIAPVGSKSETYPLSWESGGADGSATFAVRNVHSSSDFAYAAWLHDGRTRRPAVVRFVPRPVVDKHDAWVRLPAYAGLRPDGSPYEQPQPRGEISGLVGTTARVQARTHRPVTEARLEVLGRPGPRMLTHLLALELNAPLVPLASLASQGAANTLASARAQAPELAVFAGPETVVGAVDLNLSSGGLTATGEFELLPEYTGYRTRVKDRHGFANLEPPRRGVRVIADEPPHVALLPERFAAPGESLLSEDTEVEGLPVPLGHVAGGGQTLGSVRIAYTCRDPYGLDRARLKYRVNEGPWYFLPLQEIRGSDEAGPFDPRQGAFEKTGPRDQIEFHAVPTSDPENVPGRLDGGGRFDFLVRAIPGLKLGDQVELAVEVFDRNPDPHRKPGQSEIRRKEVVSEEEFVSRVLQTLQQEARIRQLEKKQRGVFDRPVRN